MGAGRCGSTFVMNKLNEINDTNIYGEDMGSTLCLLNLLFRINNRAKHISRHPAIASSKVVSSELIEHQLNKSSAYIGNEFYFDAYFHNNIKTNAEKCLTECFNEPVTGFKEIRWDLFADLSFLSVLNNYYSKVVYVNLTRNIDDIVYSAIRADFTETKDKKIIHQTRNRAMHKQKIIQTFIETQKPKYVISGDITTDVDLMSKIKRVIYEVPHSQ